MEEQLEEVLFGRFSADAPGVVALVAKDGKVIYQKAIFRLSALTKNVVAEAQPQKFD